MLGMQIKEHMCDRFWEIEYEGLGDRNCEWEVNKVC